MPIANPVLLMQAIKDYLRHCPRAADSADGIAMWWLAPRGIHATPRRLALALRTLVRQRQLSAVRLPGGAVLYAAARIGAKQRSVRAARRRATCDVYSATTGHNRRT